MGLATVGGATWRRIAWGASLLLLLLAVGGVEATGAGDGEPVGAKEGAAGVVADGTVDKGGVDGAVDGLGAAGKSNGDDGDSDVADVGGMDASGCPVILLRRPPACESVESEHYLIFASWLHFEGFAVSGAREERQHPSRK